MGNMTTTRKGNRQLSGTPSVEQINKIMDSLVEMDDYQIKQLITGLQQDFIKVSDGQNGSTLNEYYVTDKFIIPKHDTDTIRPEYLSTTDNRQKQILFIEDIWNDGLNDLFSKLNDLDTYIGYELDMRNISLVKPDVIYPANPGRSYPGFTIIPQHVFPRQT